MINYYDILGVAESANEKEVKAAYKKLALRYHPDKNPGNPTAEEEFKKVNEAYQVLSDPEKKAGYDLLRNYQYFQQAASYSNPQATYSQTYRASSSTRRRAASSNSRSFTYDARKAEKENFAITGLIIGFLVLLIVVYALVTSIVEYQLEKHELEERTALIQRVDNLFDKGDYRASLIEIDRVIDLKPSFVNAILHKKSMLVDLEAIGEGYYQQKNYKKALACFVVLSEYETIKSKEMAFKIADCFDQQKLYDEAIGRYQELASEYPNDMSPYYLIANILAEKQDKTDEALIFYDKACKMAVDFYVENYGSAFAVVINPKKLSDLHFDIFFKRGMLRYEKGEYKGCLQDCNWASFLRPKRPGPYFWQAESEWGLGNRVKACHYWSLASELEHSDATDRLQNLCR